MREQLKALAEARVAQYPQYKGHFDNYVLVRIKRRVKTKMGVAFEAGEVAIANPVPNVSPFNSKSYHTVWSVSNGVDTSVRSIDVEILKEA